MYTPIITIERNQHYPELENLKVVGSHVKVETDEGIYKGEIIKDDEGIWTVRQGNGSEVLIDTRID